MEHSVKTSRRRVRVQGHLKEMITFHDEHGNVLKHIISPLMTEFHLHDFVQIVVGATLLAIPVGFTEETWVLGRTLGTPQAVGIAVVSLTFLTVFIYYNNYVGKLSEHKVAFIKRVLTTYVVALAVVGLLLTLIDKAPWLTETAVAIKRVIIVALPASLSAAVADMIKPE